MDIGTAIGLARGLSDGKSVGDSSSVTVAKAQGASQDGKVTVILDGDTEPIEIPTVSAVSKDDDVLVAIRDGSPSAMGAFGSGDAIAQHFWHDSTGAHVSSDKGNQLDMTAEGMAFKQNGEVAAVFSPRSLRLGIAPVDGDDPRSELQVFGGWLTSTYEASGGNLSIYAPHLNVGNTETGIDFPHAASEPMAITSPVGLKINGAMYVPPNGITTKPSAAKSLSTTFSAVALAQVTNVSSDLLSVSGNRITCSKSGYIVVDANGFCSSIASRQYAQVGLFVSGTQSTDFPLIDAFNGGASAYYASFSGTGIVHVSEGQYLEFRGKTSSGTATLDVQSRFTVRYISLD